jgi:signal transduction histidine kinase
MAQRFLSWLYGYGGALGAVGLALLLMLVLEPLLAVTPEPLFFVAVLGSTWYGGLGAGILATAAAAAFMLKDFLVSPLYSLSLGFHSDLGRMGLFTATALALNVFTDRRRSAEAGLRRMNQDLAQLGQDGLETLFRTNNTTLRAEIAERERVEQERQQLIQRLEALSDRLEQRVQERTAELRRANEGLQQFANVVSHDLQEPLRTVASFVQRLAQRYQGRLNAEADEFISYAVDGATRMQQRIQALLAYARIGSQELKLTLTNCEELLQRVLQDLQVAIAESEAKITRDPLPTVRTDATQLGLVLQNLRHW